MLHRGPEALERVRAAVAPDQAVNAEGGVLPKECAKEKTSHKPVRAGRRTSLNSRGETGASGVFRLSVECTKRRRLSTSFAQCGGRRPSSGGTPVPRAMVAAILSPRSPDGAASSNVVSRRIESLQWVAKGSIALCGVPDRDGK